MYHKFLKAPIFHFDSMELTCFRSNHQNISKNHVMHILKLRPLIEGVISLTTGHGFEFFAWSDLKHESRLSRRLHKKLMGFCGKYQPPDIPHITTDVSKRGDFSSPMAEYPNIEVVPLSSKKILTFGTSACLLDTPK